jgi:hypothetical protein
MGCRCAGRTIRLSHSNWGGVAGNPGSLSNGLEWVAIVQNELSACLMITGEEVLETLGFCQTDWNGLPLFRTNYSPAS